MARSRRRHIVQSNLDYLSEELTEEENILQQLATPSEQETVCDDSGEGNEVTNDDVDIDDGEGNEDTDVDINVRGKLSKKIKKNAQADIRKRNPMEANFKSFSCTTMFTIQKAVPTV
uniref:Uncharacterized protein n=1 Tax=Oryza punctata TaxID=4537 RepID=A0A0E0MKY1_ORYPU